MADSVKDTSKTISSSSLAFFAGTLFSRITGLVRDVTMAFCFGSNPSIAAFMVAFRLSNLMRRLLGEGPLQSGFIPYFEEIRSSSSKTGAEFFRDLFSSLAVLLLGLLLLGELVLFSVWKWGGLSPDNSQILYLTILMLPGIFFICLFGLSASLLQCQKSFFLTGAAPVAFNVVWIAIAWTQRDADPFSAALFLSVGVVFAFLMQWMMLFPKTLRYLRSFFSWKECFQIDFFSNDVRRMVKPLSFGILGVAAVQINTALDALFARAASLEGPAYLWYAIRIQQLPLALFGIALSAALLPPLSRAAKEGLQETFLSLIRFAYRKSFSLIFPCTMGIFVLGACGINLVYGRGDFDTHTAYETTICLWGYGLGLVPATFVLLIAPAFYAQKDFRTPMFAAIYSMALNIVLTAFLVFVLELGAFSIALATSLCAWVNYFYLSFQMEKQMGNPWEKEVVLSLIKTFICSLAAGIGSLAVGYYLLQEPFFGIFIQKKEIFFVEGFSTQLIRFAVQALSFVILFFGFAKALKANDLLELVGFKEAS
ncbi:MAG: murein biosynthesis integral membrane protein MurJ [Chlamydiales bacterium]|nr:murein biosynthesis integral membrane protein MurJ [Chlamydiales bacterium]